jgi:uncharacterized membrane protein YjjP (DUF1212 family)
MHWPLDRATHLTDLGEALHLEPLSSEAALKTTALAATLLFVHGQTTERTVIATERLGRALGVAVKVLPYWGELTVEVDGTSVSQIVPVKPLGVDMGRVLAITTVIDRICNGTLRADEARSALTSAGRLPPASTPRFTLFAAVGAGALISCMLVSIIVTPVADRLHLPFAALAFSAVVSMMPGFFLFNAAAGLVELVAIGPGAPPALLTGIVTNSATAFLVIMAMTLGLILPRMLFERFSPGPA